jgi:hypothetical protein
VARLYRASGGVPRLVNILAHKALMLCYGEGQAAGRARHVKRRRATRSPRRQAALALAVAGRHGALADRGGGHDLGTDTMSLINKMLQDLDARGPQAGGQRPVRASQAPPRRATTPRSNRRRRVHARPQPSRVMAPSVN